MQEGQRGLGVAYGASQPLVGNLSRASFTALVSSFSPPNSPEVSYVAKYVLN